MISIIAIIIIIGLVFLAGYRKRSEKARREQKRYKELKKTIDKRTNLIIRKRWQEVEKDVNMEIDKNI